MKRIKKFLNNLQMAGWRNGYPPQLRIFNMDKQELAESYKKNKQKFLREIKAVIETYCSITIVDTTVYSTIQIPFVEYTKNYKKVEDIQIEMLQLLEVLQQHPEKDILEVLDKNMQQLVA